MMNIIAVFARAMNRMPRTLMTVIIAVKSTAHTKYGTLGAGVPP